MTNNNFTLSPLQESTGLSAGWISGFIDSDGSFGITINGSIVNLVFNLTQHIDNTLLFEKFPIFFGAGSVNFNRGRLVVFNLSSMKILEAQLFPLLAAHPLLTQKQHDFADFKRVHAMKKQKLHLTKAGLEEIRLIKEGMNRGRKF